MKGKTSRSSWTPPLGLRTMWRSWRVGEAANEAMGGIVARTNRHVIEADRLAKSIRKYQKNLTTFLHKPEVEGANNAAERAIRPAVVMRKITRGSRSKEGARAWSILASVMCTAEKQGRDVLEAIKTLLQAEWAGQDIAMLTDTG